MQSEYIAQEKDVIEKAYEVTTNPEILDQFEEYWEAYLDTLLQNKTDKNIDLTTVPINAHILRAIEIIERMGVLKTADSYAQNIVDSNYGIGFIVDKYGNIISQNVDAKELIDQSMTLSGIDFDQKSFVEISNWIKKPVDCDKQAALFKDVYTRAGRNVCLFITPLKLIDEDPLSNEYHFLIASVDFDVDYKTLRTIQNRYDLTEAETEILVELLNGRNNREISEIRNVSKITVDKQVKQIRLKTDTRSVVELVRRIGTMSQKMSSVRSQISRESLNRKLKKGMLRRGFLFLKDGRQYEYIEQGHPRGEPVLHIHTLLSSGRLTPTSEIKCAHKGWRFISPSRHGYGESHRASFSSVMEMVDKSVDDFCQLLDHLNIEKAYILEAKYGQRFAARYPNRVKALICINTIPIWDSSFLQYLSGRKRNMVKTSIHAPAAVRYLARVGHLLIQSGRERVFLNGLNKENPTDLAVLDNQEIYDVLETGVRHVVAQGVEGHAWDVQLMHTDQSQDIRRLQVPVSIIYGEKCHTLPKAMVESYTSQLNNCRTREVKGAGAYLIHTHFDEVLDELKLLREHEDKHP